MTQISAGPPTQLVIAPFGTRLGAYLIDSVILAIVYFAVIMVGIVLPQAVVTVLTTALGVAWPVAWLRTCSATPGKLFTHLRVQPASAPGRLTWSQILARVAVTVVVPAVFAWLVLETTDSWQSGFVLLFLVLASFIWLLVDCLSSLGNPRRQAIHDRAAETVVVQEVRQWQRFPAPVPGGVPPNTTPPAPPGPGQ